MEQDLSSSSPLLLRLRGVHPISAVIAGAFVVWVVVQARRRPASRHLSTAVLGLLAIQFALGLVDVLLLAPVWMQILHLLGADLYWVALVALAAQIVWPKVDQQPNSPRLSSV
jgi:cytochrome c oxidase assembly protein subunit 15